MEIYRGTTAVEATLPVPTNIVTTNSTSVDVFLRAEGERVYEFAAVAPTAGFDGYTVSIPWEFLAEDRDFVIEWEVTYVEGGVTKKYEQAQFIQLITPILSLAEVQRISGWTDQEEIKDLERRVRYAIQSYTGQNFGRFRAQMNIPGSGDNYLALPAPLLKVYSANFPTTHVQITNGGLLIRVPEKIWFGIKDAPPEYVLDQFHYTNGPISVRGHNLFFNERVTHKINGLWGYYEVPADVQQAARMLVADYSCDESLWRDRYINSVRAGNWRFEVHDLAFNGTGNVAVDQILLGYRKISLAAV